MYVNITGSKQNKDVYIYQSFRKPNGKTSTRIYKKLGKYNDLIKKFNGNADALISWAKQEAEKETSLFKRNQGNISISFPQTELISFGEHRHINCGCLFLKSILTDLKIHEICNNIQQNLNSNVNYFNVLCYFVYLKIFSTSSNCSSQDIQLSFLGIPSYSSNDLNNTLSHLANNLDSLKKQIYKNIKTYCENENQRLYYDRSKFKISGFSHSSENSEIYPKHQHYMSEIYLNSDSIPLTFDVLPENEVSHSSISTLESSILKDYSNTKFFFCSNSELESTIKRFVNQSDKHNNRHYLVAISANSDNIFKEYVYPHIEKSEYLSRAIGFTPLNIDKNTYSLYSQVFYKNISNSPDTKDIKILVYYQKNNCNYNTGEIRAEYFYVVATNSDDKIERIVQTAINQIDMRAFFTTVEDTFIAKASLLDEDVFMKAHFLISYISLLTTRVLYNKIQNNSNNISYREVIRTIGNMQLLKLYENNGYMPSYTRTSTTDRLHEIFGFRTDYQYISELSLNGIISESDTLTSTI